MIVLDDFNRTALGTDWSDPESNARLDGSNFIPLQSGIVTDIVDTGHPLASNQYAEITITNLGTPPTSGETAGLFAGVIVRDADGTAKNCYKAYLRELATQWSVVTVKMVGGSQTSLGEVVIPTPTASSTSPLTLGLAVDGSTLTPLVNGGAVQTYTDTSVPSGQFAGALTRSQSSTRYIPITSFKAATEGTFVTDFTGDPAGPLNDSAISKQSGIWTVLAGGGVEENNLGGGFLAGKYSLGAAAFVMNAPVEAVVLLDQQSGPQAGISVPSNLSTGSVSYDYYLTGSPANGSWSLARLDGTRPDTISATLASGTVPIGPMWLRLRWETGGILRYKAWTDGTSEPVDWLGSVTDGTYTPIAVRAPFVVGRNNDAVFGQFGVAWGGPAAPTVITAPTTNNTGSAAAGTIGAATVAGQRGETGSAASGSIGSASASGQRGPTGSAVVAGIGSASASGTATVTPTGSATVTDIGSATVSGMRALTGSVKVTGIAGAAVSGSRDTTGSITVASPPNTPIAQGTPTRFGVISVLGIGDASASGVKLGVLDFEILSADGGIDSAMAASGVFNSFEGG